jgi:uncharacterized membrane protein YczE
MTFTTRAPSRPPRRLANLSPAQQLRAGLLGRRLLQLMAGLVLYGVSMALMVRSGLGLDPWDVLHYGIATRLPLTFGQVVIATGVLVLLLWVPLRQLPGVGTVANALVIGLVTDAALALLVVPEGLTSRTAMLVAGIVLNGLATALYIGAQLGPGPRDGLMTGLVRRTGWSVRVVRTSIELSVVLAGWLLGGVAGVGTIVYALAIGPLVQLMLPRFVVEVPAPREVAAPVLATPTQAARADDRPLHRGHERLPGPDDPDVLLRAGDRGVEQLPCQQG